jgi:hypothetical protein
VQAREPTLFKFTLEPIAMIQTNRPFLGNFSRIRPGGFGGNQLGFAVLGVSSGFLSLWVVPAQIFSPLHRESEYSPSNDAVRKA